MSSPLSPIVATTVEEEEEGEARIRTGVSGEQQRSSDSLSSWVPRLETWGILRTRRNSWQSPLGFKKETEEKLCPQRQQKQQEKERERNERLDHRIVKQQQQQQYRQQRQQVVTPLL